MIMDNKRPEIMRKYREYLRRGEDVPEDEKKLLGLSESMAERHRYITREVGGSPGIGNVGALEVIYQIAKLLKNKYPNEWGTLID
jgi:hypothetical protein